MATAQILGTIWVCVDCMFTHANGECGPDPDREPLNLIREGQSITMGVLPEEHNESCTEADREEGCDCDHIRFSWSSCEGCGSTLGGDRYNMTLWQD